MWRKNPLLTYLGLVHLALALLSLFGVWLDPRLVGGVNPWIKPIKFDLSITIFAWTMVYVLQWVPAAFARRVSVGITAAMATETLIIGVQAARGVKSHFNQTTPYDYAAYGVMGAAIAFNTFLLGLVAWHTFRERPVDAPPLPQWRAIQLGLVSIVIGSFLGAYMAAQPGHTVGVPDGGPGLPFLNWSQRGGDLRIAHFFGLHGLQLLLLLGWGLRRREPRRGARIVEAVFAVYTVADLALFGWAIAGRSLAFSG